MRKLMLVLKMIVLVLVFAPTLAGCLWRDVPCGARDGGLDGQVTVVDATIPDSLRMNDVDPVMVVPTMDAGIAPTLDATVPNDLGHPSIMDGGVPMAMDAGTSTTMDAGSSATPDAGTGSTSTVVPARPMVLQATALPSTLCHGRRLSTPADWIMLAGDTRMRLWHICYHTPTRMNAGVTPPAGRAEIVSLQWYDRTRGMQELGRVYAPRTANPWTANFLVAAPEGVSPVFNLRNHYSEEDLYAVDHALPTQPPVLSGELQMWRVAAGGTQTVITPRPFCYDPARMTDNTFFWPDVTMCDGLDSSCNDMFLFYRCNMTPHM